MGGPDLFHPRGVAQRQRPTLQLFRADLGPRLLDHVSQTLLGLGHDVCHIQRRGLHFQFAHTGQQE
jgi:hypothetical protein